MKAGAGLWLGVALAFALLAAAWVALFFFAGRANVQTVPLATPAAAEGAR
jgi:hypothetical protein